MILPGNVQPPDDICPWCETEMNGNHVRQDKLGVYWHEACLDAEERVNACEDAMAKDYDPQA